MHHSRHSWVLLAALGFALSACGSEFDQDDEFDMLDDASDLDDPYEAGELELLAPDSDEQSVSSCLIASETEVLADKNGRGTVTLTLGSGIPHRSSYDFEVTPMAVFDKLGWWTIKKMPYNAEVASSSSPGWNSFAAGTGSTFDFEMVAAWGTPTPGWVYDNVVTFRGNGFNCSQLIKLRIPDCSAVGWWWNSSWPTPWFDAVNCYVAPVPAGEQAFVWGNSWYIKAQNGNCAIGSFDGYDCYVGSAPGGHTPFVWSNNFYFTP